MRQAVGNGYGSQDETDRRALVNKWTTGALRMNNPEALVKLIKEAPKLAGEVMPGECSLSHRDKDNGVAVLGSGFYRFDLTDYIPDWFCQAVAGNLAEWLTISCGSIEIQTSAKGYCITTWVDADLGPKQHTEIIKEGKTIFVALIETVIAVYNKKK